MKTRNRALPCLASLLLASACDLAASPRAAEAPPAPDRGERCGEVSVELIAGQHTDVGAVSVYHDATTLCVAFAAEGDWFLTETHVAIATDPDGIPQAQGNPIPGAFPYQHEGLWTTYDEHCVLFADLGVGPGDALTIAAHAVVAQAGEGEDAAARETAWGEGHDFPGNNWGMHFEVVPAPCEGDGGGACGLRTQTQGGWGAACAGDNPGCSRDAHFDAVFPEGLVVGCDALSATLASAAAIERALPTGGAPRALLPEEAVVYVGGDEDPSVGTVLFGQVVALALNVAFDGVDGFKLEGVDVALDALVIVDPESPCVGMSVAEVLAAANLALGGCPAPRSPAELGACAALINEAFVDGEADGAAICSDRLALPESPVARG